MGTRTVELPEIIGGVVVGVDGLKSARALRTAIEEANRRDCALHVVREWSLRTAPRPPDCPPGAVPAIEEYEKWLAEVTDKLAREQLGENQNLDINVHVVHVRSPEALIAMSEKAELLVISHSGGRSPGPVADQCVRCAKCPVLVVRPDP
ncbi:universal stress protein [Allokutzneria sp. A3M-2-11 16]|uniref:universal stress protein n=1 Tax=Allokutzneria sp. A3M-2-11 16 TaxID=2962043 RepID=UPI0020B6E79B|nr:universal stress protein [Allokutzneria sp. A3M-2-11 16]MCP3799424.1 universal stress protein [Allokutzneria sp. A3M-2-11 16]